VQNDIEGNEQCSRIFGLAPMRRHLKLSTFSEMIHPDDVEHFRKHIQTALRGLNIFHDEFRVKAGNDRTYKWISAYGRVIAHKADRPLRMIGVLHDITEKKLLEKQKDDFISIASHELKSPVTSIKSYSEMLQDNLDQSGDNNNGTLVRKLNEQVERLVRLIYNLLDYSSLGELQMKLMPEQFDINQLVSEHVEAVSTSSITHKIVWQPSVIGNIHADRERIRQVLDNLVSNAIKYSEQGSEIIIATRDLLDSVEITVKDSGIGIPAEAQGHIFERYFRVSDTMQRYNSGLGLGLYISAEIIRQHHGTIRVESSPGKGSTFYVTLPYT
jgi:two-component system, chemotaxis family, CheB/CheR fusion protein